MGADDRQLEALADELAAEAHELVGGEGTTVQLAYDCRYVGQSHELTVTSPRSFAAEHARRNGYARDGAPVEVVAVRARATATAPMTIDALPAPARRPVHGPDVVVEEDCTVWVPDGWTATPRELGAYLLEPV